MDLFVRGDPPTPKALRWMDDYVSEDGLDRYSLRPREDPRIHYITPSSLHYYSSPYFLLGCF